MALTDKQRRFIDEYFVDFNATGAAIRAGYSERSAYSIGWENLRKPEIQEAIARRFAESHMTGEEALMRLAAQARGSLEDLLWFDEDAEGNPIGDPVLDLAAAKQARKLGVLKKYKQRRRSGTSQNGGEWQEETIEVELYDAQRALELIGRHHKLFTDNIDITSGGKPINIIEVAPPESDAGAATDDAD